MIQFIDPEHLLQKIAVPLRQKLETAQENRLTNRFRNAGEFAATILEDVKLKVEVPGELYDLPISHLAGHSHAHLTEFWRLTLASSSIPGQVTHFHIRNLAQQTQLVEAFDDPSVALNLVKERIKCVVESFPTSAQDLEKGKNPGDVLDPYILAAAQFLMCGGDVEAAIGHTVAHKALMMIEGLMGHLHEDVIGSMRGNVRVPEPRGTDQETLDLLANPFPGADVVQPPSAVKGVRFHQIKSKTGSAKGGDGRRLGEQLLRLQTTYGGEIFYDALVGNTIVGHRSRAGVERAAPTVIVLVGEAAFEELTGSRHGAELLLRVYLASFAQVADESGYRVDAAARSITEAFQEYTKGSREGFLESVLQRSTSNERRFLDSRFGKKTSG